MRQHDKTKIREGYRYFLVGITTTFVNIGIYHVLIFFGTDYRIANAFAIILCKIYGYLANKLFVFNSHCENLKELLWELVRFIMARGITGVLDYFGVLLAVEAFNFDKVICKYVISLFVILINFVLGKYMVFRNTNKKA